MEVKTQTLWIYETKAGEIPFSEWLKRLKDKRARAKIRARIGRLQIGNFGDYLSVGGGVFELRIPYGPGYRVYFGRQGDAVVILLLAGDKRSQPEDIERAKKYWKAYQDADKKL